MEEILENGDPFPNTLRSTEVMSPVRSLGCCADFISLVKLKYRHRNKKKKDG